MATGCFEVDTDNLRRDVNILQQHLQVIEQAYAGLRDKMTEVSGMWEGPAKEACHLEFIEVCKQMREVLESMDAAAKEYDSCDSRIKSIIDAIQV